jgi:hypothetical protein
MPFLEEAPLHVQEHSALLDALGLVPGEGALGRAADPREGEAAAAEFAGRAQAALAAAPPYAAWLQEALRG